MKRIYFIIVLVAIAGLAFITTKHQPAGSASNAAPILANEEQIINAAMRDGRVEINSEQRLRVDRELAAEFHSFPGRTIYTALPFYLEQGASGNQARVYLVTGSSGQYKIVAKTKDDLFSDGSGLDKLTQNEKNTLDVDYTTHAPDDPHCCPTEHRTITLILSEGELLPK